MRVDGTVVRVCWRLAVAGMAVQGRDLNHVARALLNRLCCGSYWCDDCADCADYDDCDGSDDCAYFVCLWTGYPTPTVNETKR